MEIPDSCQTEYVHSPVFLTPRRSVELENMTVTASKVMFYHKRDTLIFNADAFALADGAMLDALLAQLPGVEMRGNGVIFCNGRRAESLLINGRDIFNGKMN